MTKIIYKALCINIDTGAYIPKRNYRPQFIGSINQKPIPKYQSEKGNYNPNLV